MDIPDILNRVVALGKLALSGMSPAVTADGRAYIYAQEGTPYFYALSTGVEDVSESEEISTFVYTIELRLIVGKVTEGYQGEVQEKLYDYIPVVITRIKRATFLQSATYPTHPEDVLGVEFKSCSGLRVYEDNTGNGTRHFGASFIIECTFEQNIDSDYS